MKTMNHSKGSRMDYNDFGARVRRRRQQLGWTQEQLARELGVSTSFIGHVERGSRKASLETLVSIAKCMNVSADYLLATSLEIPSPQEYPQPLHDPHKRTKFCELVRDLHRYLEDEDDDLSQP